MPVLNEEENLEISVGHILEATRLAKITEFEIIIVNDGSTDRTPEVIKRLEQKYPFVRSVHHETNLGVGKAILAAFNHAKYDGLMICSGDGFVSVNMVKTMLENAHRAEFIVGFAINTEYRTFLRAVLSRFYSLIYTTTFMIHVRDIHSFCIFPVKVVRKVKMRARRFGFFSELMVKILKSGVTYYEIGCYVNPNSNRSSAFKLRNILDVVVSYVRLALEVYVIKRKEFGNTPHRVIPEP